MNLGFPAAFYIDVSIQKNPRQNLTKTFSKKRRLATAQPTLAGSSCEGATFQAAVLYKNVRPDISTKGNLFEFM